MPELLHFCNVTCGYEKQFPILKNLSLSIYSSQRVALLGANGAGKSTFFLTCCGILPVFSGKIEYRGQTIKHNKKDLTLLRQKVGLVFQNPDNQIIAPSVEGEISFGPFNLGLSKTEVICRTEAALNAMQLQSLRARPPHYLSGGEKKRVTIADILAMQSELILFDEPTANLDPTGTCRLKQILQQLHKERKTLVISTHDIDFAWHWADRIILLKDGILLADGTPDTILTNAALLRQANLSSPMLVNVARVLQQQQLLPEQVFPKTVQQLQRLLKERNDISCNQF